MFYRFGTDLFDPGILRILGQILIIQPDAEGFSAHKLFTLLVTFSVLVQIKVINIPACPDRPADFQLLLIRRINFRLEALLQFPSYTCAVRIIYTKIHEEWK